MSKLFLKFLQGTELIGANVSCTQVMCSHHVMVQHFKENLQLFMYGTSKVQDGDSMSLACLQKVYLCR